MGFHRVIGSSKSFTEHAGQPIHYSEAHFGLFYLLGFEFRSLSYNGQYFGVQIIRGHMECSMVFGIGELRSILYINTVHFMLCIFTEQVRWSLEKLGVTHWIKYTTFALLSWFQVSNIGCYK